MLTAWDTQSLIEPTRAVLLALREGDDLQNPSECGRLPVGVEGVFRRELPRQWRAWPPESTTDGLVPELVVRRGRDLVELVGMCFIDFASEKFPVRAEIELTPARDDLVCFTGQIGEVDGPTGRPPRLSASAMIIPDRNTSPPVAELLVGHRVRPVDWTTVITWRPIPHHEGTQRSTFPTDGPD